MSALDNLGGRGLTIGIVFDVRMFALVVVHLLQAVGGLLN
jgi:hypothetical protein